MLLLVGKSQRHFTAVRRMQADSSIDGPSEGEPCHGQIDLHAELQCTTRRVGLLHMLVLDVQQM